MNFASLDLNLLRVFDAMMLELSTTRAGERVGLSQPAVSAALGRLRHITGDELFVRDGNRMVATPRAAQLREPIRGALRQLEEALRAAAGFDPATAVQTFVLLGSDYFSTLLMPRLAERVLAEAPSVTLQMLDYPSAEVFRQLSDGRVDAAVDRSLDPPEWIVRQTLFQSFIVCVARKRHPVLEAHGITAGMRIPPDVFCRIPHVMLSMDGGKRGSVDPTLAAHGLSRRVAMTVPHFQAVALTVNASRMLGNLPAHFARHAAGLLDLDLYLPPFDPPLMDVCVYWHKRHDRDAGNLWLRRHIELALDLESTLVGRAGDPIGTLRRQLTPAG